MPKSKLNSVLLRLDAILSKNKCQITLQDSVNVVVIMGELTAMIDDQDFEVNRDLFDGVSNSTRRMLVVGLVSVMAGELRAAITQEDTTPTRTPRFGAN